MAGLRKSTVLLSGFGPFGGEAINPSWEVAQALHGKLVEGARIQALCLPCVFGEALQVLAVALRRHRPQLVLALGQAAGRGDFSVERVAINVNDARIADNAGALPIDAPVIAGAPAAYFSTLPIKAIVAALHAAGLPASVSQSAGTIVCNHVFYGLMHALRRRPGARAGFMHLPLLPEQAAQHVGQPSLPLTTLVHGVELALLTAARTRHDLHAQGGSIA